MSFGAIAAADERSLDLIGLGEVSLDRVIELDEMPRPGGKHAARSERDSPGGQIATAVLGCARLGLRTAFVGAVGDDDAADRALAPLETAGVDLAAVQRIRGGRTRKAVVLVEHRGGERSVIEQRDPRVSIDAALLSTAQLEGARALLVDGSDPQASLEAAQRARAACVAVFLDADRPVSELEKLLPWVDFPVVSQGFAEEIGRGISESSKASISPRDRISAGLEVLCRAGARVAVATLGERGSMARSGNREWCSAAFRVAARDTTGAGDAFRAAWLAEVLAAEDGDENLELALRRANAAAAMNCLEQGAQGGLASCESLDEFLSTHRQDEWHGPS